MNYECFYRGFLAELSKVAAKPRSTAQIAKGEPAEITLPVNRKPPEEQPRSAGATA